MKLTSPLAIVLDTSPLGLLPAVFGMAGVVVATANVGHLSALTIAVLWSDIEC